MLIAGFVPLGCLPFQLTLKFRNPFERKCIEDQNLDSRNYNEKLVNLLPQMQAKLPHSHIAYADVYEPLIDMINNPTKYGKFIHLPLLSTLIWLALYYSITFNVVYRIFISH
jgi:hypothetical protein